MTEPSDSATRDPRGRFVPGVSGNPAGMKPGTHHHRTRLGALLQEGEFETIGRSIIEKAKAGHWAEQRFLASQLDPKPRHRTVALPGFAGTLEQRYQALCAAVARSEIAPAEAAEVVKMLEGERRLESGAGRADAERRIAEAERGAQEARDEAGRLQARLDTVVAAFKASQSGAAAAAKRAAEREVALRSACVCRQNGITPPAPRSAGAPHHASHPAAPVTPSAPPPPAPPPAPPAAPRSGDSGPQSAGVSGHEPGRAAAVAASVGPASAEAVAAIGALIAEAEALRASNPARCAELAREAFMRAVALTPPPSPPPSLARQGPRSPP